MRILVNVMRRDDLSVHCLAADCHTLISRWVMVRTEATLLRLLKASGATTAEMGEIERDMSRWGRGNTFIEVNETGRRLLRILPHPRPRYTAGKMPEPKLYAWSTTIGFIRQTGFIRRDLFVRDLFVGFIRQTGLGLWKRSFLRIEGELALPLICDDLLSGSSLL